MKNTLTYLKNFNSGAIGGNVVSVLIIVILVVIKPAGAIVV